MRRADKQIKDPEVISEVVRNSMICRIGLAKDNRPYIVPVSFGYDGQAIYFHSAVHAGKKIEYIQENPQVCFECEREVKLVQHSEKPCHWSFSFQSVIGYGAITELLTAEEKVAGLHQIMAHYSDREWDFSALSTDNVRVWKIVIEHICGKQSKDHAEA